MTALPDTLNVVGADVDWSLAVCASILDDALFYPPKGHSTHAAKRVCNGCPIKEACLTYALENAEIHGVWGGLSERDRRRLKGDRADHVCPSCKRRFASLHGLTCHAARHAGEQHHCPVFACGRSFPTANGRAMHERRVHGGFDPIAAAKATAESRLTA